MALQGKVKTVSVLQSCHENYEVIPANNLEFLRYVPLEFDTIHIRVYYDGSFQNLPDKNSQVDLDLSFTDDNDICKPRSLTQR